MSSFAIRGVVGQTWCFLFFKYPGYQQTPLTYRVHNGGDVHVNSLPTSWNNNFSSHRQFRIDFNAHSCRHLPQTSRMARRMSEARQREAAAQASRRMIARGEPPGYRLRTGHDGRWHVDALPWLSVTAASRREALDEARTAKAKWLEVDPSTFDVEA